MTGPIIEGTAGNDPILPREAGCAFRAVGAPHGYRAGGQAAGTAPPPLGGLLMAGLPAARKGVNLATGRGGENGGGIMGRLGTGFASPWRLKCTHVCGVKR